MDINNPRFTAAATDNAGKNYRFDAVECAINYQKDNDMRFAKIEVTDYKTERMINAVNAYYLKSNKLPSPMGANISAYSTKLAAEEMRAIKGGEILDWNTLLLSFKDSRFGSLESGHNHHSHRPDEFGPAGVKGDHVHAKGGLMVSLSTMQMQMDGMRNSAGTLTNDEVFANYMVAPQSMDMQMMMLGVMYAPSNKVTLMLMQGWQNKQMDLTAKMMMGGMPMMQDFSTKSNGLGDMQLSGLISLASKPTYAIHLNTGISLPIGSIEITDKTPMDDNSKLPYGMQLGSGTFDATVGATLRGSHNAISYGLQQLNVLRLGNNSAGYNFGNEYQINAWGAYCFSKYISTSFRINATTYGAINGVDATLNPMMVPMAKGANYSRTITRSLVGVNSLLFNGKYLVTAEVGVSFVQKMENVYMNEIYTINAGVKRIL